MDPFPFATPSFDDGYYWAAGGYAALCFQQGFRALEMFHALCTNPSCNYVKCIIAQGPASTHYERGPNANNLKWCPRCRGNDQPNFGPGRWGCKVCDSKGFVYESSSTQEPK